MESLVRDRDHCCLKERANVVFSRTICSVPQREKSLAMDKEHCLLVKFTDWCNQISFFTIQIEKKHIVHQCTFYIHLLMHHAEDDGIVEVEVLTPMPSSSIDAPHKCMTKTIMLSSSVDAARWQWNSSSRLFFIKHVQSMTGTILPSSPVNATRRWLCCWWIEPACLWLVIDARRI